MANSNLTGKITYTVSDDTTLADGAVDQPVTENATKSYTAEELQKAAKRHILCSCAGDTTSNSTQYTSFGCRAIESDEGKVLNYNITAGTIKNLYVHASTAPGASESYTITLRKNQSDTSLVATISNTDTTANDTSNTVTVTAGDKLTFSIVSSTSAAANMHLGVSAIFEEG